MSVSLNATPITLLAKNTAYAVTANGISCLAAPCATGVAVDITYLRLWLDEASDDSEAHVIANPGKASEPFLDVTATPCLAGTRNVLEEITGSINPAGSTLVSGSGTAFLKELVVGDKLKVSGEVRTITTITSDTSLQLNSALSDNLNDFSPERAAAPAYLGGMGQPYGGRSTILAFALGEESFVDDNGNNEYDYGETFSDLTEVILDKNEDGVFGDVDGDSASVTSVGPYSDAGSGGNPVGGKRDKSSPFCYGPQTIVGDLAGLGSSTEHEVYCYQDGGEEELFVDADKDGVMDVGNGIYNGSRCRTPMQDADGDGDADDVVCTTDLLNISREVQILMSGSRSYIAFRTTSGGANGGGELISEVEQGSGQAISNTASTPPDWTTDNATAVISKTVQKGAEVNTDLLTPGNRDVQLFTITNAFTTPFATWDLSFDVTRTDAGMMPPGTGDVEVFASGTRLTFESGTCGESVGTETCTVTKFTVPATGDLVVGSVDIDQALRAEINNFSITGTTTGLDFDYGIINDATVTSNDNTNAALTDFDVGNTIDATTVFAGVSERTSGGILPQLSTSETTLRVYITDLYNGQLPDGTEVEIESNNSSGCTIAAVGGLAVTSPDPGPDDGGVHSGKVTIGSDLSRVTFLALTAGFGSGPVTTRVTTPIGNQSSASIRCDLGG